MPFINENYLKLQAGYLFPEIDRRVKTFAAEHPEKAKRIIRCGIGDVTEPLPAACIAAIAGERPASCMIPVPSRMRFVSAAMYARGVIASEPYASAVQTES